MIDNQLTAPHKKKIYLVFTPALFDIKNRVVRGYVMSLFNDEVFQAKLLPTCYGINLIISYTISEHMKTVPMNLENWNQHLPSMSLS